MALVLSAASLWPGVKSDHPRDVAAQDLVSADPSRRLAAVVRLGTLGRPDDLRLLRPLLDRDDVSLRLGATRALARAGDPNTIDRLAAHAADKSAAVRLESLTMLREAAFLPAPGRQAAERALGDADATFRLLALDLLSAHPTAPSVPTVAGLLGDTNRDVRLSAARLLGLSRDPRAVLPLLHRIDGQDRVERVAVIAALGSIGRNPRLDAGPALIRQLEDPNEDVRLAAIDALGRLRAVAAVPSLATIATRRSRDISSRRATLALGAIGDDRAIDVLVDLLREPAPAEETREALRQAGPAAVKDVAAILPDAPPTSAAAASEILAAIGDRTATSALGLVLKNRPAVAMAAARALGSLRDPTAVPVLMHAIADPKYTGAPAVRLACLHALSLIGDAHAAGVVEGATKDADPDIRVAALRLAAVVHGGVSISTLAARFADGDPAVRRAAIEASAALPALRSVLLFLNALGALADTRTEELAAIGDAMESLVTETDRPFLLDTLTRLVGPRRVPVLRALATLPPPASQPPDVETFFVDMLAASSPGSRAAAEVVAMGSLREASLRRLLAGLPELEAPTRARLCPLLAHAGSAVADEALTRLLDHDPDDGVRASAAWAAAERRGVPSIAAAIERARMSSVVAVADNASAALTGTHPRPAVPTPSVAPLPKAGAGIAGTDGWVRVRLLLPDRNPASLRWIRIHTPTLAVWALTDDRGEALVRDLPAGPYRLSTNPEAHATRTEASISGKSPAITPFVPCSRAARCPAQP